MTKHLLINHRLKIHNTAWRPHVSLETHVVFMCLLRHMWSSSSVVYYKSVIYPIHESQYSQSKLQNLTKTCGSTTYNTKWLFFVKFISDISKDIILLAQWQPFLMVTSLHSPTWLLFLWLNSIYQIPHNLLFSCTLSESLAWLSFFFEKEKEKKMWKWFWLDISMTVCLQRPLQFQLKLKLKLVIHTKKNQVQS